MSRIWATKYGIFDVRNGSVAYTEIQSAKKQLVTVRNGSVTGVVLII